MHRSRLVSTLVAVLTVVLIGATATACGDGGAQAATDHNAADVSFVSEMIPHHQQAVEMVDLTEGRDLDPEFLALARQIRDAQEPEIVEMQRWLDRWSAPAAGDDSADAESDADGMSMGGDMDGMMSSEQLTKLAGARDGSFRRLWLQSMIEHHQGALGMARGEVSGGKSPEAVALAGEIQDTQAAEIRQMQDLLAR
ncbi:MAG: DUF305 domain-containing protein [Nocardioides sp.]|nr:DUF305 domain-containing protein [Nocardioides sp.]